MQPATFLAVITFLLGASSAPAVTLMVNGDTPSIRYQRWADTSALRLPGGQIDLTLAASARDAATLCGAPTSACYFDTPSPRIILTVNNDVVVTRQALYHELGHWVDHRLATDAARRAFLELLSDDRGWDTRPDSPREKFAVVFEMCAAGHARLRMYWVGGHWTPNGPWRSGYYEGGYNVRLSRSRLQSACTLVATTTEGDVSD